MTDVLDDELTSAFERAHEAPQWAMPGWPDSAGRVRRAATRARTRYAAAAAVGLTLVAGGALAAVHALPSGEDRVLPSNGGNSTDANGATGAKWLLSPSDFDAYTAAHPSPSPSTDRVPSPAPSDAQLAQLQRDVSAALPAGATTVRSDAADGGVRGDAIIWLRLADGTPVAVERTRLDYPRVLSTAVDSATEEVAPEHFTDPQTWADGTAYTIVTGQAFGYGLDRQTQWSGPFVWTVTPDGWFTMWTAPVASDTLLGWAQSADASFVGG